MTEISKTVSAPEGAEKTQHRKVVTVVTHDGPFQADDVFAVQTVTQGVLRTVFSGEEIHRIIRTRDQSIIDTADVVVDVGGVVAVDGAGDDDVVGEGVADDGAAGKRVKRSGR